jgi:MFS family permease
MLLLGTYHAQVLLLLGNMSRFRREQEPRMHAIANWAKGRFRDGWVAIAVTFLVMLITAGTRATPSVMMVPLEHEFGWNRATISLALSINLALFGLMGPFAAAAILRFGLRRTVLTALSILAAAVALSSRMQATWQLH